MTEKQQTLINRLAEAGFPSKWWGPQGEPVRRIYFRAGRKDAKVWLEFDEPAECAGAALRINIEPCGQSPKWYAAQRQIVARRFHEAFAIALEVGGSPEEAARFRREWEEAGDQAGDMVGEE